MNEYHQWSNNTLRMKLWRMKGKKISTENLKCPKPEYVWEGNRNKKIKYLKKRKELISAQIKNLSEKETVKIKNLYKEKDLLNSKAGFIKFHVDHIQPISRGGQHKFDNLRIITAYENLSKGSK